MKTILVVDDEQDIVNIIKTYFEDNHYIVITASNTDEAYASLSHHPEMILLDIMMPGMDGIDFCQKIRDEVKCPIVFLSARTEENSKIKGLSAGGDDYITKPFSIRELYARVEAHLRRENRPHNQSSKVYYGKLWVDYTGKEVGVENRTMDLTKKEYAIMEMLSLHSGQVFSQERIYEQVWGYDAEGDAQSAVTEHIKRIRKKLNRFTKEEWIETIWGVGYKWKKH